MFDPKAISAFAALTLTLAVSPIVASAQGAGSFERTETREENDEPRDMMIPRFGPRVQIAGEVYRTRWMDDGDQIAPGAVQVAVAGGAAASDDDCEDFILVYEHDEDGDMDPHTLMVYCAD